MEARVWVNFTGKLMNGTVVTTTTNNPVPYVFNLDHRDSHTFGDQTKPGPIEFFHHVIPGLRKDALVTVEVPYNLAFGAEARRNIPAYSDMIFDIEIVDWQA